MSNSEKNSIKSTLGGIIFFIVLCILCFVGGIFLARHAKNSKPIIDTAMIGEQLKGISQLSTIEYNYTNMGQFEKSKDFYGMTIPFSTKRFIVSYDGVIKAGIDINLLDIEINGKNVDITLPAAQILSHEIDEESLQIFDESKNIFNPISIQDYNQFQIDQKKEIEQKATEKGFLTEAQNRAQQAIQKILEINGVLPDDYHVNFHQQEKES